MTFGNNPYNNIQTIDQMKTALKSGQLLLKPQHASATLYNLMKKCWNLAHRDRPTFAECLNTLQNMTNDFFSCSLSELTRNIGRSSNIEDEMAFEPFMADSVETTQV